jgi:hypothetical protein
VAAVDGSGFNAAEFRDAIHFAMRLGAAPDPAEQVTFHFASAKSTMSPADGSGTPFNPNATIARTTAPPVKVDCAVEYFDAEGNATAFGFQAPTRLRITLLDVDYEQVEGCAYVVIHGDRYNFRRTEPPLGLFDVGLKIMHFTAEGES